MFCTNCGRKLNQEFCYCPVCGQKIPNETHLTQENKDVGEAVSFSIKSTKPHFNHWIIITLLIIFILLFSLVLLIKNFNLNSVSIDTTKDSILYSELPSDLQTGSIVTFGNYNDQDIEWIVLNVEDEKILLISKESICEKEYNELPEDNANDIVTTWENCTLRKWLNNDFLISSFSEDERSYIVKTVVENPDDEIYGGGDTDDSIYLLSPDEWEKYCSSDNEISLPTSWWLRSPGNIGRWHGYIVNIKIDFEGPNIPFVDDAGWDFDMKCGVRPVLWLTRDF